ncbi:MAG: hypothetical protein AYL32_008380 [Candidatus Bathyarchaeota archaeon B26-2]|nr:MAG: hypothetical protein AYL32_008380 [Candidatus Bathyarchaeota archaeon B26-2]
MSKRWLVEEMDVNVGKMRSPKSVLAITTASHMMQHIYVGTSILFPFIMTSLNLNYTEFGVAIAASSLFGGIFQLLFSVASRKIARHVLLGLGNVLLSLGTFLTGIAQNFNHFLGFRTIANIGVAPQHPMGTAIVSEKFDEKSVGRAIGIHYGVAYLGNIIGPLAMIILVATLGWRKTLFVFSIPALIIGLSVIWFLSGDENISQIDASRISSSLRSDIATLIKTPSVIPIILTQALLSGGIDLGIITTYIPLFLADDLNFDVHGYAYGLTYTIGLLGGVCGPILLGKYADRVGHLKMATFSSLFALALVYLLSLYDSANLFLAVHLFLLGLTSFALPTLLQSHLVSVTEGYNKDLVVGVFFTVGFGFGSLWSGIIGYMIDVYSSFKPAFLLMGTLGIFAFLILTRQLRYTQR